MADTVDPAASLSPADEAEERRAAAPADEAEEQRAAPPPDEAPTATAPADEAEEQRAVPPPDEAEEPEDGRTSAEDEAKREEDEAEEPEDARSVKELLEQLSRELSDLGVAEGQLEAARNLPEVRRAARDIAGALVVVVAALTAFALVNVAAVTGLSRVMETWLAALLLAAVWIAIALVLLFGLMGRARRWLLWIVGKAPPKQAIEELKQERDAAGKAAVTTLERLGPALATQIALAAIPKAGDVAGDVASGAIEVGDTVLDASDEIIEVVTEQIPGGGVVNQVWDVVLVPGRLGVRVATTILRRGRPGD